MSLKYLRAAAAFFACVVVMGVIVALGSVRPVSAEEALKATRIAVLPWKVNAAEDIGFVSGAMVEMLSSRIGSAGGFEMVRSGAVKGTGDSAAAAIGKSLKLDYVFYGSLTVLGGSVSVDSRLFDVGSGKSRTFYATGVGLDSVVSMADKLSGDVVRALSPSARAVAGATGLAPGSPTPGGVKVVTGVTAGADTVAGVAAGPSPKSNLIIKAEGAKPGFWKSTPVKGSFVASVAADLDRDGVKELFLVAKTGVTVAVIKDAKLKVLKRLRAPSGVQYIGAFAFDSDGDGTQELYVSGVRDLTTYSSVVEFTDARYMATVTGIRWLLRRVNLRGTSKLIGQRFRESDGFYGGLRVLKRAGSKLIDSGPFEVALPKGVDIYHFTYFAEGGFGEGSRAKAGGLRQEGVSQGLYEPEGAGWSEYWKSSERYGGTLNYIESDPPDNEDARFAPVGGAILQADLDSDGRAELIVRRNTSDGIGRHLARPASFKKGSVMAIEWDGEFIAEKWRTREVSGYIADFFIDDLDSDGASEVVMLVVEKSSTLSGRAKSYILSYKLSL